MKMIDRLKSVDLENLSEFVNYELSMEELRLISFHLKSFIDGNEQYSSKAKFEMLSNIITIDHLEHYKIKPKYINELINLLMNEPLSLEDWKITRVIKTIIDYDRKLLTDKSIMKVVDTQEMKDPDFIHFIKVDDLLFQGDYQKALDYLEREEHTFTSIYEKIDLLEIKVELLYHFGRGDEAKTLIDEVIELSKKITDKSKRLVIEYRLKMTRVYLNSHYSKLDIDLVLEFLRDAISKCTITSNITEQMLSYLVFNYEHYSDLESIQQIVSLYFEEVKNSQNFLFYSEKHQFSMILSYRIGDLSDVPKIIFSFKGLLDHSKLDENIRKVLYLGDESILEQPDGYIDQKYYDVFANSVSSARIIVDA